MTRTADLSRGFSLIEVLVALAVMSLVATVLIASLELGGRFSRQSSSGWAG
jgi:prepilin-type N-terminal cleavage/methylation domain-containing protein